MMNSSNRGMPVALSPRLSASSSRNSGLSSRSSGNGTGAHSHSHSQQRQSSGAAPAGGTVLVDQVPNIQLGGPKGVRPTISLTPPQAGLAPATAVGPRSASGSYSPSRRHQQQQQQPSHNGSNENNSSASAASRHTRYGGDREDELLYDGNNDDEEEGKENAPPTMASDKRRVRRQPSVEQHQQQHDQRHPASESSRRNHTEDCHQTDQPADNSTSSSRAATAAVTAAPRDDGPITGIIIPASPQHHQQQQQQPVPVSVELEEEDKAVELFHYHYYYYPDEAAVHDGGDGDNIDINGNSIGSMINADGSSLPASATRSRLNRSKLTDDGNGNDDVSELEGSLLCATPPTAGRLLFSPPGEVPFTPRGMPQSPFMHRLGEFTAAAAVAAGRGDGSGGSGSGAAVMAAMHSPRRRGTLGSSSSTTLSLSNRGYQVITAADDEEKQQEEEGSDGEEAALHRAELEAELCAQRKRLTSVRAASSALQAVIVHRSHEVAGLSTALEETTGQREALVAQLATVSGTAKEMAARRRKADELAVLHGMLSEKQQRVQALGARRDGLSALWDQLCFLHDEAQTQEARRRHARKQAVAAANGVGGDGGESSAAAAAAGEETVGDDSDDYVTEEKEDGEEGGESFTSDDDGGLLSASERRIKSDMLRVSGAHAAHTTSGNNSISNSRPPLPGASPSQDSNSINCGSHHEEDNDDDEYGEEEEEPEAASPLSDEMDDDHSAPQRHRRAVSNGDNNNPHASVSISLSPTSASLSRARGPSIISVGTVDILQSFLSELYTQMDAMGMECIQKPSPPPGTAVGLTTTTSSMTSRTNNRSARAGASAWRRDINTGNNGFYSFFGGATEAHLSAKPLATFLSCAERLARSAWRAEARLQLKARELATDAEEEQVRRRVNGRRDYEPPAPLSPFTSDDDDDENHHSNSNVSHEDHDDSGENGVYRQDVSQRLTDDLLAGPQEALTPEKGSPASRSPTSRALMCSPELSRSCGKRRTNSDGSGGGCRSPATATPFTPAPMLFLPSIAYAAPRLPCLSSDLDARQLEVQRSYERDIESQRARRRATVRRLRETYKAHVEPQLLARLQAQQRWQQLLAESLVALGVAEVALEWEEAAEENEDEEGDGEDEDGHNSNMNNDITNARASQALGRSLRGAAAEPKRYLRQVTVKALQVDGSNNSGIGGGNTGAINTTTSTSSSSGRCGGGASAYAGTVYVPSVTTTRQPIHRLSDSSDSVTVSRWRSSSREGSRANYNTPRGTTALTATTTTTTANASTSAAVLAASCSSPHKTVTPFTPSPLKGCSDFSSTSTAAAAAALMNASAPRSSSSSLLPLASSGGGGGMPPLFGGGTRASSLLPQLPTANTNAAQHPQAASSAATTPHTTTTTLLNAFGGPPTPTTTTISSKTVNTNSYTMSPVAGAAVNLLGVNPMDAAHALRTGAVRASVLFFGPEAHRRHRRAADEDRQLTEFWRLREELARAEEGTFRLTGRLEEAEAAHSAQRGRHTACTQEAAEKLAMAADLNVYLVREGAEWRELLRELEAMRKEEGEGEGGQ